MNKIVLIINSTLYITLEPDTWSLHTKDGEILEDKIIKSVILKNVEAKILSEDGIHVNIIIEPQLLTKIQVEYDEDREEVTISYY